MTLIQLDPICYELWISAKKSSEPGLSILLLYYRGALAPHRPLLLLSCLGSGKNLARPELKVLRGTSPSPSPEG